MFKICLTILICCSSLGLWGQTDTMILKRADVLFQSGDYTQAQYFYSLAQRKKMVLNSVQLRKQKSIDSLIAYSDTNRQNIQWLIQADSLFKNEMYDSAYQLYLKIDTEYRSTYLLKKQTAALNYSDLKGKSSRSSTTQTTNREKDSIRAFKMAEENVDFHSRLANAEQHFFDLNYSKALVKYQQISLSTPNQHTRNRITKILNDSSHLQPLLLKIKLPPVSTTNFAPFDSVRAKEIMDTIEGFVSERKYSEADAYTRQVNWTGPYEWKASLYGTMLDLIQNQQEQDQQELIEKYRNPYAIKNLKLRLEKTQQLLEQQNINRAKEVFSEIDWRKIEDAALKKAYQETAQQFK